MSRPVIRPLSVGATAPESLSVLQQRLLVAEEQTEELLRDLGTLGMSGEQLETGGHSRSPCGGLGVWPLSPVKVQQVLGAGGEGTLWRQCEVLVGRVCRLESLLHTLKLTTFRLETERALNPSHTASLREQLAALQQQCEEEQRSSQREVMSLREQLKQACEEREEAREEAHTLRQQLDISQRSKVDVALAADELKILKDQMSQKLQQMKEELEEENTARLEAEQSHSALLQRVEEMEGVVEREREQVKLLQADCHTLRADGQETRAELQEKEQCIERLQKECEQLRNQLVGKDTLLSELSSEFKSVRVALQKQQENNCRLVRDGGELKAGADKIQALNDQLEAQCSDLSSALRSLTAENARLQATLQLEQKRVAERSKEQDVLLETAKKNIQAELQGALSDRLLLKKELDALRADHTKLQQSSAAALETATAHHGLLDRTVQRLRREVSTTARERESLQRERDEAKTEMSEMVSKLGAGRVSLESQVSDLQVELCEVSSALQNMEEENRGLRGRLAALQQQQYSQQQLEQMLRELMDSRNKLTYEKGKLQVMDAAPLDSEKHSLEMTLLSTQSKKDSLHKREAELVEARAEIGRLVAEVDALKFELRKDRYGRGRSEQRGGAELKTALEETSARSGHLSRANQELREKVSELEKLVSYQTAQLQQHQETRAALRDSRRLEHLEAELKSVERSKSEYEKKCYEQSQSLLQMRSEMAVLQAELQDLSSIQHMELQAERSLAHSLQEKCQSLEESVVRLREEKDETELKMKAVSQESLQISENMQEAHCWFRSRFHSPNSGTEENFVELEKRPGSRGKATDSVPASPTPDMDRTPSSQASTGSVLMCVAEPELERWASTIQRWETKKEQARITSEYKHTKRAHSLT